ncbi:MAG: manganese efflux pump MntP family protein [Lentimicrobiaceae bacterium]|nr:manganese efflux pump MntP family protein [Lentimicrobiaceae bacterium]
MEHVVILLIAIGLSFDTFAVSVSSGLAMNGINFFNAVKIALSLAFFQALMPLLGWFIGIYVKDYVIAIDHWIAFALLLALGLKMIFESLRFSKDEVKKFNPLNLLVLLGMSIATSIDAFAVGISFAFLEIQIIWALFIIGIITFIISMLGILFGKKTGSHFGKKMEIIGGLTLIGIGIKILVQHLYFS